MAKIGNEAKLILKLVNERMAKLRDSRIQTPDTNYCSGYNRAISDYHMTVDSVVTELEETARTPFSKF
ncbi:hypothetical protein ES703_100121 [subsurface metagenome]